MLPYIKKARKVSILPTSLDIFGVQKHYIRILYLHNVAPDLKSMLIGCLVNLQKSNLVNCTPFAVHIGQMNPYTTLIVEDPQTALISIGYKELDGFSLLLGESLSCCTLSAKLTPRRKRPEICLGFHAVSTVFHLFNGDSSQIRVSWTTFNQYITTPLS